MNIKRFIWCLLLFTFTAGSGYSQHVESNNPDSLLAIGDKLTTLAKYEQAASYFEKARELFLEIGDSLKWAEASLVYGETLVDRGNVYEGLKVFLKIDSGSFLKTDLSIAARVKSNIGWAYSKLEDNELELRYKLDGLTLAEQANDSTMIARLYNNLTLTYEKTGELDKALEAVKKALSIFTSQQDKWRLAIALNNAQGIYQDLGLYDLAEKYMRQSVAIREEINNPDLLDVGYHNLAALYKRKGQPDSAIIYYQKSLAISRKLDNPYDITQTLENIGDIYFSAEDYQTALMYYRESLDINEELRLPKAIADDVQEIGDVYYRTGNLPLAEEYYNRTYSILKNDSGSDLGFLYLDMANVDIQKKNYGPAFEKAEKAFEIGQEIKHWSLTRNAIEKKGRIFGLQKNYGESISAYTKAYAMVKGRPVSNQVWPAINLSRAFSRVSSDSAFYYAKKAFELIEGFRTNLSGLEFKAGMFRDYAEFYYDVAEWHITINDNPEKAYELVEAAKARVLLDELAEARNNFISSLDEPTQIRKQQFVKKIDRLHNEIAAAEDTDQKQELQRELRDTDFEYQSFLNEIRLKNEKWKDFEYPKPISAEAAKNLPGPNTAIIEYAFTDESLLAFVVTSDQITASVIESPDSLSAREFFANKSAAFREAIITQAPTDKIHSLSRDIYFPVLHDQLNKLQKVNQLVIVSDGPLTFLPFEALSDGQRFLIEDYNIKYLPSATIYSFIQNPHRNTSQELLALAGSGFETGSLPGQTRSQANFASLPYSIMEVDSIASYFKTKKVLKNEDVTEAGLKSHDLESFQFIHFATHGNINEEHPLQSGLILSNKGEMESLFGEDGYLNSMEITSMKLNSDMIVLSACNTGMGKIISGEGLLGLQRSFLSAGASSVVVSLWNVFDKSTALFMSDFYKKIMAHKEKEYGWWEASLNWLNLYEPPLFDYKTKALRDAKLNMLNHPYYNHPIHWAPFILVGK